MEAVWWATVTSLGTLIQEVFALQAAMEMQGELILFLVKLQRGSPGLELGEILEVEPE